MPDITALRIGKLGLSVGDEARLLVTFNPAGAEYFFVPRDDSDMDPFEFGLELHGPAPAG